MAYSIPSNTLRAACQTGNFEPLQNLASHVNSYDEKGSFLLARFVETEPFTNNHAATLPRLITYLGANVNLAHKVSGKTALHCAANFGNQIAVRILLNHGANVDAKDKGQSTPLMCCAAFAGNSRVIQELLSRNATIEATSRYGQTALHFAVEEDQVENATVLLLNGARQLDDIYGQTPVQKAKSEAMRTLLRANIEDLRRAAMNQLTDRIQILLTKANPLADAISGSDTAEAQLLMGHQQFTPHHLEEGFRYAFTDDSLRNYEFIFNLFAEKTILQPLAQRVLDRKQNELRNLERDLERARGDRDLLSTPDTRTADDFDLGRGDFGDQAQATMNFQNFLRTKEFREKQRLIGLDEKNNQIKFLSQDKSRIENQIVLLQRFLQRFNQATGIENDIDRLALTDAN